MSWDTPNELKESMDLGSLMDSFYKGWHIQFLGQMGLRLTWLIGPMEIEMAHNRKGHFVITTVSPNILKILVGKSMGNQYTGNHGKTKIAITMYPLINKRILMKEH